MEEEEKNNIEGICIYCCWFDGDDFCLCEQIHNPDGCHGMVECSRFVDTCGNY